MSPLPESEFGDLFNTPTPEGQFDEPVLDQPAEDTSGFEVGQSTEEAPASETEVVGEAPGADPATIETVESEEEVTSPTPTEPMSELDELRAQLDALRQENGRLLAGAAPELLVDPPSTTATQPSEQAPPQTPQSQVAQLPPAQSGAAATLPMPPSLQFTDDDLDMLASTDNLGKVAEKIRQQTTYQIMQQIPSIVQNLSYQTMTMMQTENDFFAGNADLLPFKSAVERVAAIYQAQDPRQTLGQVLEKGGEVIRKKLNIGKGARRVTAPGLPQRPVAPNAAPRKAVASTTKSLAAEILELADTMPQF